MIKSFPFNAIYDSNGVPDRAYLAEDFARYFAKFIGTGVYPNPATGLQVVAVDNNMQIRIKKGDAYILGRDFENTDDYIIQLDVADGVLSRIDRVALRLDYLKRDIIPVLKKGNYASSPIAPALQRDADAYEIALADVYVKNGVIKINQSDITDTRLNSELCGIVHAIIQQVDTTEIFRQFQAWFNEQKNVHEGDFEKWLNEFKIITGKKFEDWVEDLKNSLDPNEDIAAQLQMQISTIKSDLADMTTDIENIDLNADKVTLDSSSFKSKNVKGALEEVFTSGVSKKNKLVSILTSNGFEELTTNNTWEKILNTMESYNLVKNCIQLQEKFYGQFMINNKFLYRNDNKVIVELLTNDSYVLSDGTYDRPDIVLNDEDYFIFYYSNSRTMHCFKKSNKIWQKTFKTDDVSNVIVKFGRVYINNYSTGQITSLLLENGNEVASYSGQQLLQIGVGKYNEIFGLEHISTGYNGKEYYKLHKWSEGVHSESANFEFGFAGQRVNLNKIYFNFDLDKDCVYLTCFGVLTGCRILKLNNNLEPIAERNNDLEREVSVGANRKNIIIGANLYFDTNNKGYGIVKIDKDLNKEEYMTDVYFNAIFDSFGYVYISSEQRVIKYKIY
ncbi:tail fiber protein [Clostridium sporogenes]|nr:phage tail protein [Clostridium sporogenes]SUY60310.1 tail fiber protein [Clostridium sporogenes]